jgi:hypothetical protein
MSTKFLRKTTRRLIRDYDQYQDAYPSLIRSSDPLNNGVDKNTSYSDTKTIVFSKNNVSFPAMVPAGSTTQPSSSIITNAVITPSNIEQRPSLPGSVENITPFNESLFNLPATQANTGSISYVPGFNTPVRNKIGIPINITATDEHFMLRLAFSDTNADPDGYFYGRAGTGFCYYNFVERRWDDIGLVQNFYKGYMGDVTPLNPTTFAGQDYFMAQFVGTPNTSFRSAPSPIGTQKDLIHSGYPKIGTPTEFFDAPYAPRYHATSSQGLQMSSYIQQPFVLERIDVKIPIVARRKHGNQTGASPSDPYESSLRDIDNLVFFLYRQAGNDPLTSQRFLIAHESISFYNSKINSDLNFTSHNPVFSYDYDLSLNSNVESLFTGSISFSMYPKITSPNFAGISSFVVNNTAAGRLQKASTLNYWTGPLLSSVTSSINRANGDLSSVNNPFWREKNTTFAGTIFEASLLPDQRFLINYATGALTPTEPTGLLLITDDYSSANWSQFNAPYLMLPTDQLIFGLESDINAKMSDSGIYSNGTDKSYLSQTSSFFKILTDDAQVTLYGSLVQNSVAKTHNSINQSLISPAVHEIIANIQDDTDQFDIAEKELYVGTYLDNFITGTMALGNRGVAQSIIDGPQLLSGSFIRCLPLEDADKIYLQKGTTTLFGIFVVPYAEPRRPKNYFRSNRFGQHRDMLEQARDYRIFNKKLYKKNGGFEDYGPVYAKFVLSSSETPVSASLTFCNNLSTFMTGTFPFVDAENTSRGVYPTSPRNNPFTPKTLIFKT